MSGEPMSRDRANLILRLWKSGVMNFSAKTIRAALVMTGDLQ